MSKGAGYIKARLSQELGTAKSIEAIPIRISNQPLHPLAALRQGRSQRRNFSTAIGRTISTAQGPIQTSRPIAGSAIRSTLAKSNFAPFSSPLRPNLTGGAIPRSSGGYTSGGHGARYFSSTPAAQAHVIQNVSAAIRAFCINGSKVQYDGTDSRTGLKKFRAVTVAQDKLFKRMCDSRAYSKGTILEFVIAPTITVVPTQGNSELTLGCEEIMSGLASDFSRSLGSLAMIHTDLKKLASLGSLPISYPNPHTLSVRFAGCDAKTVNALCNELGIQRGIVREDPEWDEIDGDKEVEMALLFPWAPSKSSTEDLFYAAGRDKDLDWQDMMVGSKTPAALESSHDAFSVVHTPIVNDFSNPWQSARYSAGYDALHDSDIESNEDLDFGMDLARTGTVRANDSSSYEGIEGMLRFYDQCNGGRR